MRVLGSGAELGLGVGGKVIGERCFLGGMLVLHLDFALKNTIIPPPLPHVGFQGILRVDGSSTRQEVMASGTAAQQKQS